MARLIEKGRKLIYGLFDPHTQELRYVGKSSNGLARPTSHLSKHGLLLRDHCHSWIRSLVNSGLKPEVEVIEEFSRDCSDEMLNEAEMFWIAYFRMIGCRLTNLTDGGEGMSGLRHSEETKRKIGEKNSIALLGHSPWNKGKPGCFPASTIEEWKKVRTGKKQSEETKSKRTENLRGKKRSPEVGKKISAALLGKGKSVICLDDGNIFTTVRKAAEFYSANRHCVSAVCRGLLRHANGKHFAFKDD